MRENHYEDEEIKYDSARAPDLDEYQLSPVHRQQQEKTASIDEQLKEDVVHAEQVNKENEKKQKREAKRTRVMPIYRWFFTILCLITPILNIFLLIYWAFFSDRVNKNLKNLLLAFLIFVVSLAVLIATVYFNVIYIDPNIVHAVQEFFANISVAFARLFTVLGKIVFFH